MRDHFPDWVGVPNTTPAFCPNKKNPEMALHIVKKTLCQRPCTCDECRLENIDRLIGAMKTRSQKIEEVMEKIIWIILLPYNYIKAILVGRK